MLLNVQNGDALKQASNSAATYKLKEHEVESGALAAYRCHFQAPVFTADNNREITQLTVKNSVESRASECDVIHHFESPNHFCRAIKRVEG